jgi:RNA polymerase sigma factor (sigma-70 family)
MSNPQHDSLIGYLRFMLASWKTDPRDDAELLHQFAQTRDEAAFAALVVRYGKQVWDICRSILGDGPDAEDAFQNTFIRLSQQTSRIVKHGSLMPWITAVARRTACTGYRSLKRQQRLLQKARGSASESNPEPSALAQTELRAVLCEEMAGLPESLRVPLMQRYLEGKTLKEMAALLGCTDRNVAYRLERGEAALRRRLARRGLSSGIGALGGLLTVNSARATMPAALLESTVRAALAASPASAGLPGMVAALAGKLLASRLRMTGLILVVLLVGGGIFGLAAYWGASAAPGEAAQNRSETSALPDKPKTASSTVALHGQLRGRDGTVLAGARIAILTRRLTQRGQRGYHDVFLVEQETDREGRYHLDVPTDFASDEPGLIEIKALLRTPSGGLVTTRVPLRSGAVLPPVEVGTESPLRGRLLDPEGQPAVGVRVRVVQIGQVVCQEAFRGKATPPGWPIPVSTDKDGVFVINRLAPSEHVQLAIEDERYGVETIDIPPLVGGQKATPLECKLRPPRLLRGRIVGANNHKPLGGVRVTAIPEPGDREADFSHLAGTTDAEGRFRLPLKPGTRYQLEFVPADEAPYLAVIQSCPARHGTEAEFTLPSGLPVKGQITDQLTNKPIVNALVQYVPYPAGIPGWREEMASSQAEVVLTNARGEFNLTVARGKGHLLIRAQEDDYRVVTTNVEALLGSDPFGGPIHAHAIVPLEAGARDFRPEVKVALRRGVEVQGAAVRADGKAVSGGFLISRRLIYPKAEDLRPLLLTSRGEFTLRGCEPGHSEEVILLDSTAEWGALTRVSPRKNQEGVTVQLERCGSVRVTLLDHQGKPLVGKEIESVLDLPDEKAAGAGILCRWSQLLDDPYRRTELQLNVAGWPTLKRLQTDANGQVELKGLVPRANYRIRNITDRAILGGRFVVQPGQQLEAQFVAPKPPPPKLK